MKSGTTELLKIFTSQELADWAREGITDEDVLEALQALRLELLTDLKNVEAAIDTLAPKVNVLTPIQ